MVAADQNSTSVKRLPFARLVSVYVLEVRVQCLELLRTPGFTIPTLLFPLMFYVFFAVVLTFSPTAPTYLLATYTVFGLMGPSLYGFGVGLANERESGALRLKQTTPMPVAAYLLARIASALMFGMIIVAGLFLLGAFAADVVLYRWQWLGLAGIALTTVIPFCALGFALGAWIKAQAAIAIVNAIYLPMAFLSGLWIPIAILPSFFQDMAVFFPAYHQAQLVLKVVDMDEGSSAVIHLLVIAAYTLVFLVVAAVGFRRVIRR